MAENEKIGEFLIRIGAMSQIQCEVVIKHQISGDKRKFGEIAIELGFVDKNAISKFLNNS